MNTINNKLEKVLLQLDTKELDQKSNVVFERVDGVRDDLKPNFKMLFYEICHETKIDLLNFKSRTAIGKYVMCLQC